MTDDIYHHGVSRSYEQPDASQAERRAMAEEEARQRAETRKPPQPTTYFAQAQSAANDAGGRFAERTVVTGSTPIPRALPGPQWCTDLGRLPDEPPLGFSVDDLPDLGFPQPQSNEGTDDE